MKRTSMAMITTMRKTMAKKTMMKTKKTTSQLLNKRAPKRLTQRSEQSMPSCGKSQKTGHLRKKGGNGSRRSVFQRICTIWCTRKTEIKRNLLTLVLVATILTLDKDQKIPTTRNTSNLKLIITCSRQITRSCKMWETTSKTWNRSDSRENTGQATMLKSLPRWLNKCRRAIKKT